MKKFIITMFFWIFFWIPFWPIYGTLFWVVYGISVNSDPQLMVVAGIGVLFWGTGGVIGGIISGSIGVIFGIFREEIKGKIGLMLEIVLWASFWALFWAIFLSLLAGMLMLRSPAMLVATIDITIYSSIPIFFFGASGGTIGKLISEVIGKSYFKKS
jgi:hypothetical protein